MEVELSALLALLFVKFLPGGSTDTMFPESGELSYCHLLVISQQGNAVGVTVWPSQLPAAQLLDVCSHVGPWGALRADNEGDWVVPLEAEVV